MSSAVANRRRRLVLSSDDDDEVGAGTRNGSETDDDTPARNQVCLLPSFMHDLHCTDDIVPKSHQVIAERPPRKHARLTPSS